ncbi:hypothetical protein PX699_14070 [Sphingobium sp. H39-3-25]|uniref:hypothetical protein n=1 Tax=Sphingobium arseniciresistens TaxID=3030834 RepID=UPI0023B88716|nr:hypothetical protein [Sphingobium arseniciresistens]
MRDFVSNQSNVIRAAAVVAMVVTIYAISRAIGTGLMHLFTGGGCEPSSELVNYIGLLNPLVLFIGILFQGWVMARPSSTGLAWALGVPLLFWSFHAVLNRLDDQRQQACAKRSLAEALRYCEADPAWYRIGELQRLGNTDYRVVTLVAPGRPDDSWMCVSRWSRKHSDLDPNHKSVEYAIEVDRSVYHQRDGKVAE